MYVYKKKLDFFPFLQPQAWGWNWGYTLSPNCNAKQVSTLMAFFLINTLKRMTTNFLECLKSQAFTLCCLLPAMWSLHMLPLLELFKQYLKSHFFRSPSYLMIIKFLFTTIFFPRKQSPHNFTYHGTLKWLS